MAAKEINPLCNPPKSINDAISNLDKYKLGDDFCDLVSKYWDTSGKCIKDYRDLDQHYYAMIQHTFLQIDPEEKILIFLPDKPLERGGGNAKFEKELDGIAYIKSAFLRFHDFAESVASVLGFEPAKLGQVQVFGLKSEKNPIIDGQRGTLGLMLLDINEYGAYTSFEIGYTENGNTYFQTHNGDHLRQS